MIQIHVNGVARELPGPCTIKQLIQQLELQDQRLAVEVDGEIVPRSRHASHSLSAGDRVEIVHAIGGG